MRSEQAPILDVGALRGVGLARSRIADIERAVAQIACMITASLRATATQALRWQERLATS
ncbi:hypothetical protein X731_03540 [Mesorhizobium sp. L2C054A000]|nr:hypothetical protein X731_03540 [Mesorhizobium sp. L2C054A000]